MTVRIYVDTSKQVGDKDRHWSSTHPPCCHARMEAPRLEASIKKEAPFRGPLSFLIRA